MTISIARRLAAVALLGAAACSSSSSSSDPLADIGGFCAEARGWFTGLAERCYGMAPGVAAQLAAGTLDCETWVAAAAAGRTTYDPAAASACLAAMSPLTCNQIEWLGGTAAYECAMATRGAGGTGVACHADVECASGQCDLPPACDAAGTCAAAGAAESAPCAPSAPQCAPGLLCAGGTCQKPPPVPAPVAAGSSCADAPCVDAAYCSGSQVCVVRQGEGQACGSAPCAYGMSCTGSVCVRQRAVGEPCTFGGGECQPGAWCVGASTAADAGRCTAWGGPGAGCGIDLRTTQAGLVVEVGACTGAWCDASGLALGTCQAWLGAGAACDATKTGLNSQCAPGFACQGTTPTCTRVYCGSF